MHGTLPVLPSLLVQYQIQGSQLLLPRILCQLHKQHMQLLLRLVFPLLLEGKETRNLSNVNTRFIAINVHIGTLLGLMNISIS